MAWLEPSCCACPVRSVMAARAITPWVTMPVHSGTQCQVSARECPSSQGDMPVVLVT